MRQESSGQAVLLFIMSLGLGALLGYVGGWVAWWIFGQIQLFAHIDFPYAAIYSPSLLYLVAWIVFGAISLPLRFGRAITRKRSETPAPPLPPPPPPP